MMTINKKVKKLLLATAIMSNFSLAQEQKINPKALLEQSGQNIDYNALDKNKIITLARKDQETTDTSIALSMGLYVKAPYATVLKDIKSSANMLSNYTGAFQIYLKDTSNLESYFKKVVFTENEFKEVDKLFKYDGGKTFNLSNKEILRLKTLSKGKKGDIKIASSFYQEILKQRMQEYLTKGVNGISSYSHLDSKTSISNGMKTSSVFLKSFKKFIPDLYKDYVNYPNVTSKETQQKFYLIKDLLEGRPVFILKHQMSKENNNMFMVAERQFFISHDLDAIQTEIVCMPYKEGTLIALSSQSFTPKVSGLGRSIAVKVGRNMMEKQIRPMLEKILKKYQK